jgi:hypothetical protein
MIEKEFTPYTEALELKQLGFDERCLAWYGPSGKFLAEITIGYEKKDWLYSQQDMDNPRECIAPTYSQAFRWFRENHNLRGFIGFRPNIKQFDCHIYDMSLSGKEYVKQRTMEEFNKDPKVGTYEEAELACLQKLIEIVKQK